MAAGFDDPMQFIRRLVRPELEAAADAILLGRYVATRDEAAFSALVARHGQLVLNTCRRILGAPEDIEEAFQAVFVILARKAASVRPKESLSAWLYGVARRVSVKARAINIRRTRPTRPLVFQPADSRPDTLSELSVRELLAILEEELDHLPYSYRLPVLLCGLEGRGLNEVARELGWAPGSVKGRLERGRARLRQRLLRRGVALGVALAVVETSRGSAATLTRLITRASTGGGVTVSVAALADAALAARALVKWKAAPVLVLVLCLLAAGALVTRTVPLRPDEPQTSAPALTRVGPSRDDFDIPVEVFGRVLDPRGDPLPGSRVYLGYGQSGRPRDDDGFHLPACPVRATSGADGRFRFTFVKAQLDTRTLDDASPAVLAVADGYGPGFHLITDLVPGELTLRLVEDLPVHGRILDQNNKPVAGATVRVLSVSDYGTEPARFVSGDLGSRSPKTWKGGLPERPRAVVADADGRFSISGHGRDRLVAFAIDGMSVQYSTGTALAREPTELPAGWTGCGSTFDFRAAPEQVIRGVVRDKETGLPVSGISLCAFRHHPPTYSDQNGRFEIHGAIKLKDRYAVMAQPRPDQHYFAANTLIADRGGFDPLTVDVELVRGLCLRGRVADPTGKPPRAATVEYYPLYPNAHSGRITRCHVVAASASEVRADGTFCLSVLPGPGVVCIAASPRSSFAAAEIGHDEWNNCFGDGLTRHKGQHLITAWGPDGKVDLAASRFHAICPIDPDEAAEETVLEVHLTPARRVRGEVIGPDGNKLDGVEVRGLTPRFDEERLERSSFVVRELGPRRSRTLVFRHSGLALGRVRTVRGDDVEPLTVTLRRCAEVTGRLMNPDGTPTPGRYVTLASRVEGETVTAATDAGGRFRAVLVPELLYELSLPTRSAHKSVELQPGQILDWGDISLKD